MFKNNKFSHATCLLFSFLMQQWRNVKQHLGNLAMLTGPEDNILRVDQLKTVR